MTDLLLKPDDTGDIPAAVGEKTVRLTGERTENLAPYVSGLAPALRSPTAVLALVEDRTALTPPGQPRPAGPLPTPPSAPPKQDDEIVWAEAEAEPAPEAYVGRHRRKDDLPADVPPGRFGWLRSVLAAGWARVRSSM